MAADILLYQTQLVPVGIDQKQHVELARTIARKFNQQFGQTFEEPKELLSKIGAKIMSLQNPKKKMSKTDDPAGCIGLFDAPEIIKKKIMSAVTDLGKEIKYDLEKKPGISNLLTIYSILGNKNIKDLEKKFKGVGYAEFKKSLSELAVNYLEPLRENKKQLQKREVYVREILEKGAERARTIAESTMERVRKNMELV
jgi:tryptophanyl-tRNA synthetase